MRYSTGIIASLSSIKDDSDASEELKAVANDALTCAQAEQEFDTQAAIQYILSLGCQAPAEVVIVEMLSETLADMQNEAATFKSLDVKAAPPLEPRAVVSVPAAQAHADAKQRPDIRVIRTPLPAPMPADPAAQAQRPAAPAPMRALAASAAPPLLRPAAPAPMHALAASAAPQLLRPAAPQTPRHAPAGHLSVADAKQRSDVGIMRAPAPRSVLAPAPHVVAASPALSDAKRPIYRAARKDPPNILSRSGMGMYAASNPIAASRQISEEDCRKIKKYLKKTLECYSVEQVEVQPGQCEITFKNPVHRESIASFLESYVVDKFKENMPRFEMKPGANICVVKMDGEKGFELLKDLQVLNPGFSVARVPASF